MANKKKKTITDLVNEAIQKQETSQKKELAPVNLGNVAKSVNNTIQSTIAKSVGQPQKQNIPISPTISTSNVTKSILGVQQNTQNKMFNDITNTKTKQTVEAPIMTPEQIKSPANMVKQQRIVQKGIERARQEGGNTSLEGTTLNALKLYGQGMMKAEEGIFIDAPVSVASFIVNAGKKVGYGATKGLTTGVSFLTGIFDKDAGKKIKEIGNSYADSILLSGDAVENKLNKFVAKDLTGNALDYYGWNNKLSNGKTVEQQLEGDSAIKRESIPGQVIEGLGGMAPSILLGGIVSSGQTVTPQNINNIKKAQNLISYSSLGARSYGNAYEEAIQNGATTEQASAYGLSNAAVEIGTEWLSGGIPGVKGTAGGGLDRAFEKYILKEGIEETSKSLSKAIVKSIYKTSMEGVEEMISQTLEPFVKQFTYQYNEDEGFIGNLKEAASKVNLTDIVKAGIVGSLTAVALGDVDIKDIKAGYQNTQAINNVIQENIANQQQQLGRELTKEEIKQTKNVVHDDVNNLSQYGEQIANTMSNVRDYNLSSEGLDLEQSYKAYNGNKKYYNQIANIQKFMNNRNINARFDATMFNDNSQNAIWTTQDGKDTVVFNPKASQDQVIQNIATHEMTHDIMAQQTETGKSLFNDVLENIKSQENYAKQRAEIEDLYAKYYDRNSQDFTAKVDEEMVANELGKNLGTQEYINRLVNEKPNLARRIYNWVVDKLDNIGKSAEYKEQKAYWKSVADKFEKAYNEQKTATGEDKTAYSVTKDSQGRTLSKEQQEFFKDSKVVDENGNLEVMYHSGKSGDYNVIDLNKVGDNTGYDNTTFGYFITDSKLFSERFKDINNEGNKGYTREFYANIKKPIIHPFQAWLKYSKNESDNILRNYLIETNNLEGLNYLEEHAKLNGDGETITDIYAYLSTYEENPFENAKQEKEILQSKGYDAVEFIEGEESNIAPNSKSNKIISSYAIFDSNQIKNIDNTTPTSNPDIRYSLTKDNTGRELSEGQREYFKDSKVVDRDGNLMVMYHGSSNGNYTIFDKNKIGGNTRNKGLFGTGFYFTENKELADSYDHSPDRSGKTFETYLNITNPFYWNSIKTEEQLNKLNEELNLKNPLKWNRIMDEIHSISPLGKNDTNYGDSIELSKALQEKGYDGIIYKYDNTTGEYVVFNSNQIKNVDNTNPTSNEDIRYSMQQQETPFTEGTRTTMGELFDRNIAPIREDLSNITEQMNNLSKQLETMQESTENKVKYETKQQLINNLTNEAMERLNLPDNKRTRLQNIIEGAVENDYDFYTIHNKLYNDNALFFDTETETDLDISNEVIDDTARYIADRIENRIESNKNAVNPYRENAIAQRNANEYQETLQQDANYWESLERENGIERPKGYVETYKDNRYENQDYAPMSEEDANMLQESLMNDEGYIRSLEEQANTNNTNEKLVSNLVKDMQNRFDVTKENKPKMEALIREAIENDLTTEEIADRLGKDFSYIKDTYKNEEIKDVKKAIKDFRIKVDDTIKMDIADYGDFQRRNFGKISFSKNGLGVDSVYQELNTEMPGYFPSNIVNPTDQLLRIAEVANTPYITTYETLLDSDYIDDAADYIRDAIDNDIYNTQMESQANLDKNIQFGFNDEILPTTIRTQESIDEYIDNRDIAPISQEQMQRNQQAPVKDRANNMIGKALQMLENRNYEMDTLAKVTGNNEIKYAGDNWNNASSEANFNINNYQTDINGKWVGDSLTTIFNEMEQQGLGLVANDYLFQKSNIERHNVGKGSEVPLAVSQQLVAKYEMEHPELKKWSKKVYKLIDNYTKEQLASGLISKEKYDSYRGEYGIYGDYVPFYSAVIDKSRYFDNDGELKSVSTFKKSKGGSSDVSQLMTMKDAIANQIFRTKEAVRKNELFKEIVQQYQKYDDMLDMDMRNDPTNLDDSLFTTPEGDKVLSAYIDGKKVSAIISDELYNELSRENENRIQQMEKDFSLITKPLQKASDIRRKLVTTWNITFLARNMIKDVQDAVINSKHTTDMLANYFGTKKGSKAAIFELAQAKTTEAQQFLALYGADNLYGDYSNVKSKFSLGKANELIELAPRFAEFKATLQNGGSINEAIYNAREVTVNFGRGGYITKALNRNGFTFLNANVQGLSKAIRNLTGQNGVKGVVGTVIKGMLFAVAPAILNDLLFGSGDDKDEEYEALPDYIKDNYYLIKLENGKFLRIPKGRINSVFGSGARRMLEFAGGDKEAFDGYLTNAWSQIGIGDLTSNNVFAPLKQAQLFNDKKNGEAWYGGDIVPKRLQDSPNAEQTDASIDALSNFIGETFNLSPYKVNYVLDQYTGGFGDILLPMITPETTSGAETPLEYLTAPIKDAFVVNSIDDNKYAGEFYTKKEELTKKGKSMYATDEDKLRSKYMDSISSQMSELYKEKREVQADTTISNSYKYEKVQKIQNEINNLAKEGLSNYESFSKTDTYSQIGDTEYYKNNEGKWTKVNESDAEFTAGLNETEKTAYYNVKNKVSELESEYKDKVKDLSKNSKLRDKYSLEKKYNTIQAIKNSGLDNQTKAMIYGKYYSTPEKMRNVANAGYDVDTYMTALYDIETIRDKYSKDKGYSTAYRKKKTLAYINSLNMNIPQKAMLVRQYYSSFRQYNNQIVNYVGNLDIAREEKVSILEDMGMKVKGNRVTWK